jgi:transcriptional regulator with XRE-family HTH domain
MSKVVNLPDRSTVRARVAAEVRAEMARADISQLRLAAATGIPQSTLNRRLKPQSERDAFNIDELEKIADALGVNAVLFFRAEWEQGPDDGGAGAPSRTRTYDLRIIRAQDAA